MKDIYLLKYAVKGIKSLSEWVNLDFYKATINKSFSIDHYNLKAIYGINGAGKTAIVRSVKILRNVLVDNAYLNNPIVQRELDALINKRLNSMDIHVDFLSFIETSPILFHYEIQIKRNSQNRYDINHESLSFRKAASHSNWDNKIFTVENGQLSYMIGEKDSIAGYIKEKTQNLLTSASLASLLLNKVISSDRKMIAGEWLYILNLFKFGLSLFVYLEQEDEYSDYFVNDFLRFNPDIGIDSPEYTSLIEYKYKLDGIRLLSLSPERVTIPKLFFQEFEKTVKKLAGFLRIFKQELQDISIEKKEDNNLYSCSLVMNYKDYSVDAEFESTGIKKLIRLFSYFLAMTEENIVFIDELDSNLHDVYLCALLEYLMEYSKGQLCFTTHNIGPMDILKRNKKSIDFLSSNHKIYSWTANGNYSPSKLYKEGMIEGSPFNVEASDFISVFGLPEEK